MATHSGSPGSPITFTVGSAKKWSPDSPTLYDVTIKMGQDTVRSYTGFRTISRGEVDGVQRIMLVRALATTRLNDADLRLRTARPSFHLAHLTKVCSIFLCTQPFLRDPLAQSHRCVLVLKFVPGFWPDGGYTPPTYEAMTFDIKTLKRIGYNMLRKHIKVEQPLYYAAADEIGILVMQDMPALRPSQSRTDPATCVTTTILPDAAQQAEFQRQLELLVNQFKSYTSIFAWVSRSDNVASALTNSHPRLSTTKAGDRSLPTTPSSS